MAVLSITILGLRHDQGHPNTEWSNNHSCAWVQ